MTKKIKKNDNLLKLSLLKCDKKYHITFFALLYHRYLHHVGTQAFMYRHASRIYDNIT